MEDDELVRARLERLLGLANFDVYGVSTAQAAREFVTALVFPMIVIDRMLEDADGIALIRELRQHYAQHRVFLMLFSALDSDEERRKGLSAGADEYLSKRASDEEVIACLKAARSHVRLIK